MQSNFSDIEYANKKKLTWRDRFLAEIDAATALGGADGCHPTALFQM